MDPLAELLGQCSSLVTLREQVRRLRARHANAPRLSPVLIQGETGTGKGLLARAMHRASARAAGPFIAVNCAAIPETLLEAEMFGYERGAFTDARQAKPGLFQVADQGTLFLDEVGLLVAGLQTKLLKAIEEREVRRLGSTRSEAVDVWIIAATSEDLAETRRARRFHEALYHRLSVLVFQLPPLRERGDDVRLLASHFLETTCREYRMPPKTFSPEVDAALRAHSWPGNVRELANAVERAVLLSDGLLVTAESLGLEPTMQKRVEPTGPDVRGLTEAVGALERERILAALTRTEWNVSHAAALLRVPRNTLHYRIAKHGLRPAEEWSRRRRTTTPSQAHPSTPTRDAVTVSPEPRWERRGVALLEAVVAARDGPPSSYATSVFESLLEKVRNLGGQLEEIGPSGLMATFGLEPCEDAAERAAQAALAMQKAVARARSTVDLPFGLMVAIHWGQILTGHVEGRWQLARDDKRAVVSALDRLRAGATPDTITVSEPAARFLRRRFQLEAGPPPCASEDPVYRLIGLESTGLGLGGRTLSPFVGRGRELEAVRALLHQVEQRAGQVVGLMGEPGVGKSRFLYEFRQSLTGQRLTYVEGHCFSYRRTTPYGPMLDVLRQMCNVTDGDRASRVAEKVDATLRAVGLDPDEITPYLLHALGGTDRIEHLSGLAPEAIKRGTFDALRRLLLQRSRVEPVVLAVEDLHWIDATSEEVLATLVDGLVGLPLLVLVTYRPGYRPGWMDRSCATQLTLSRLTREDSRVIVEAVLTRTRAPLEVLPTIVERADGNPFFLEELAWAMVERGRGEELDIPDTIQATILARIARLPEELRELLRSAAVVGRHCPAQLLSEVWAGSAASSDQLGELQRLEFLYERPSPEGPLYIFKHALTQEAAYLSLEPDERRAQHARIVEIVERRHAEGLEEHVETLAHHAWRAEVWDKAVHYLRRAGQRAFQRSANQEAVALFEHAIAACERAGDRREFVEAAFDLRIEVQLALFALGEHARIRPRLIEAERLAAGLGDQKRQARVANCLATHYYVIGDHAEGLQAARRGLAVAEALRDAAGQIGLLLRLGLVHHARGEFGEAAAALRQSLGLLANESTHEYQMLNAIPSVHARTWLVWCLSDVGEFDEANARASEARDIATARDHPYSQVMAAWGLGYCHLTSGRVIEAISAFEKSFDLCHTWNNVQWTPRVAASLGYAYTLAGRVDEGIPLLEQGTSEADRIGVRGCSPLLITWCGEAYRIAGRGRDATETARRALDRARHQGERGHEAHALRLLAEIEQSPERYRQAIELAETLGMRPAAALWHGGLGSLYHREGKRDDAEQHRGMAAAAFHQMGIDAGSSERRAN